MNGYPELEAPGEHESELKEWHPQKLSPKHKQIVALSATGMKGKEIAGVLDMSQSRVSVILNDPRAEKLLARLTSNHIAELTKDVGSAIQGTALEAYYKVRELMRNAESENVQQRSAFDLLDRAGFKPKEVVFSASVSMDREDAEELVQAMREARESPEDLEFVEDSHGVFVPEGEEVSARK